MTLNLLTPPQVSTVTESTLAGSQCRVASRLSLGMDGKLGPPLASTLSYIMLNVRVTKFYNWVKFLMVRRKENENKRQLKTKQENTGNFRKGEANIKHKSTLKKFVRIDQ